MRRYRKVAAAPARGPVETWTAITDLVVATLGRSHFIEQDTVVDVMNDAAAVGRMLIAGGHLAQHAITLTAADLLLDIQTVSGSDAITLEENSNPVPGAAKAETWTLYLPSPQPLDELVEQLVAEHDQLSKGPAPNGQAGSSRTAGVSNSLDQEALDRWAERRNS